MDTYIMLEVTASGTGITKSDFQQAINGCRARQAYNYPIVFVSTRKAVVPLIANYSQQFETCMRDMLPRYGGSLAGYVVIYQDDLSQFSRESQTQILGVVHQIENDGNEVEGF